MKDNHYIRHIVYSYFLEYIYNVYHPIKVNEKT